MTRQEFLARLREGLQGLPADGRSEILADYEAHFEDGRAAGRSEADVAAALGDPRRLARELRAETGLRRWETARTPSSAAGAVLALVGVGALDVLVALPFLLSVAGALFGFGVAALGVFVAGGVVFAVGPFSGMPGGAAAALLLGVGLMTGAIAVGALVAAAGIVFVNGVVWYARLHFRLLKPALEPQMTGAAL
jgi:uncharacterized membrane protein